MSKNKRSIRLKKIWERDKGICYICESYVSRPGSEFNEESEFRKNGPTVDHVIPKSKGGTNDLSNLKLSHRRCNETKGSKFHWRDHLDLTDIIYQLSKDSDEFKVFGFSGRIVHIDSKKWLFKKGDSVERSLDYWERNGFDVSIIKYNIVTPQGIQEVFMN